MSEKIDQFVEKLHAQLTAVEQKLTETREKVQSASRESVDGVHEKIEEAKSQIVEFKQVAVAKAAEIREDIAKCEDETKANVEQPVANLRGELNDQFNDLQQSWGDVVTDVTGGTIF